MQLTCPHCRHSLDFGAERPRFCSFCGQSLSTVGDLLAEVGAPTLTAAPEVSGDSTITKLRDDTSLPPPKVYRPGDVIGGYRLTRRIGAGAMGSVFEAEHTGSKQRVAVKLIAPEYAMSPAAVERFRLEGRLASTIAHPACVFVMAADEDAGQPFIVMELMPGTTLSTLVADNGPLAPIDAIKKILDVIDGLQEAHRLGVIHRDVKPSNCFVGADGRVKVGDFGLAKSVQEEGDLTRSGTFVGTVLFASPEQIKRQKLDAQSDVYSVCATLYFLLTGRPPFGGGDALAAATRIVTEDPPTMRSLRPDLAASLDRIVLRGLERDKGKRWHDLDSLRQALERFLPGQMSFGGLGTRFVAYCIDSFIRWLLMLPVGIVWAEEFKQSNIGKSFGAAVRVTAIDLVLGVILWCLYFGLTEGIWGCSLGKLLMRLRVCRADSVEAPGVARALLRSVVSYGLINTGSWLGLVVMAIGLLSMNPSTSVTKVPLIMFCVLAAQLLGSAVGIGVMCLRMSARNGYRGLHELASGTRVLELTPRRRRQRCYTGTTFEMPRARPEGIPEKIGRFEIDGAVRWQPEDRAFIGNDPSLGRSVWITMRKHRSAEAERVRQQVTRPTRVRWVASGNHDGWAWDAYLAPGGMPLPVAIAREGRLPWADAAPLIEQLTDELVAACADGSLPDMLAVHQVWIDAGGRVQLIGMPLTGDEDRVISSDVVRHVEEAPEGRAMHLLRDVSARLLEGEAHAAEQRGGIRAPVPRYVADCLNHLFPGPQRCGSLRKFREELHAVVKRPMEVNAARRFVHLAVLGVLMLFSIGALVMSGVFGPLYVNLAHRIRDERLLTQLEAVSQRDLAAKLTQPNPDAWLLGLAQFSEDVNQIERLRERVRLERDRFHARADASLMLGDQFRMQEQAFEEAFPRLAGDVRPEVRVALSSTSHQGATENAIQWVYFLLGPAIWVVWAFAARGGFSFRLLGLELLRADGRKAARWQCLLRALLFWAPPLAAFGLAVALDQYYWSHWFDAEVRVAYAWMPIASWLAWLAGVALLVAYFVRALWRPERSWHDLIARTWLMPR